MSDLDLLLTRRSVAPRDMIEPGPTSDELQMILRCAHRVPDHGKLGPWRFVVFTGAARADFGAEIGAIYQADFPDVNADLASVQQQLFTRAPTVIAVISTAAPHAKIPEWEQVLSAGAACQNILVAATTLGYSACWLTEWYSYHPKVKVLLGMEPNHNIAGFIYLGSCKEKPEERVRPPLEERLTFWGS